MQAKRKQKAMNGTIPELLNSYFMEFCGRRGMVINAGITLSYTLLRYLT
jgi:hypothetical protein